MLVKLLLPRADPDAQRMVTQFRDSGIASFSIDGMYYGFVRRVGEEDSGITIVADVTEPEVVAWIRKNVGESGPIETIAEILGHADTKTTILYLGLNMEDQA